MEPLYSFYLNDRAHAIRKSAVERLGEINKAYGKAWMNSFFGRLSDIITKDGSYHFKITALYSLIKISKDNDAYLEKALQLLSKSSGDSVPNIREVCVKCYHELLMKWDNKDVREKIKKELQVLSKDTDS